jgi:hypothetical protein
MARDMAALDRDRNLFSAAASSATKWSDVEASANIGFRGNISAQRGIDIDLGLMGIANLDASVSRFLAADRSGSATAQASVRGQIQLPLNLFKEVGVAVRLQAIAELAAGIRLGLGLSLGDFLDIAGRDQRMQGLPLRLLTVLLEEAEIGASLYAKAALSAQAYANFVIVGSAIGDPQQQISPGFTISAGAGAGLKAGAGYQIAASFGIRSFSRLVARSADALVDGTLLAIVDKLPDAQKSLRQAVWSARVPLKLAIRLT